MTENEFYFTQEQLLTLELEYQSEHDASDFLTANGIDPVKSFPQYKRWKIIQNNKVREIEEPLGDTKRVGEILHAVLCEKFPFHYAATATVGKGIIANAAPHHGACGLLKLDLKQFYKNIHIDDITNNFQHYLFNIYPREGRMLLQLVETWCFIPILKSEHSYTYNSTTGTLSVPVCLSTGNPASPMLANVAFTYFDWGIQELLNTNFKEFDIKYTRYIDDLTFSIHGDLSSSQIIERLSYLANQIKHYVETRFKIHEDKTKIILPNTHEAFQVTGVTIRSKQTNNPVPRNVRRITRARLHNLACAMNNNIDDVTQGYLAYIHAISPTEEEKIIKEYYHKLDSFRT